MMAFIGWHESEWLIGWMRMRGYGRLDWLIELMRLDGLDWWRDLIGWDG